MLRLTLLISILYSFVSCSKADSDLPQISPVSITSLLVNGEEKQSESTVRLAMGEIAAIEVKVKGDSVAPNFRWALAPQNIVLQESGAVLNWKVLAPGDYKIGVQASNKTGGSDLKTVQIDAVAADFMNQLWNSSREQVEKNELFYGSKLVESDDESLLYELTRTDRANGINGDSVRRNESVAYQFSGGKLVRGLKIFYREYENYALENIFVDFASEKEGLAAYSLSEESEDWTNNTYKALYNGSDEDRAKAIERGFLRLQAKYVSDNSIITLTVEGQGRGDAVSFVKDYRPQ